MTSEDFYIPSPNELGEYSDAGSQISQDDISSFGFPFDDPSELPDEFDLPEYIPLSPLSPTTCCFDDEDENELEEPHTPVVIIKKEPPNSEWGFEADGGEENGEEGVLPPLDQHPLFQEDENENNLYTQQGNVMDMNPIPHFLSSIQNSRDIIQLMKQYVANQNQVNRPPLTDELTQSILSLKSDLDSFCRYQMIQQQGNNSLGFDVRHLKKKKRTRLSSVYQDPLSLMYYVVFGRELRFVAFPTNRYMSEMLKSMTDEEVRECVDWRICFGEREIPIKNIRRSVILNGNYEETCLLEVSYVFRENSTFKFRVSIAMPGSTQRVTSESKTLRVLGYCDAQFRKKCGGEFSNRNYVVKCDSDDLL